MYLSSKLFYCQEYEEQCNQDYDKYKKYFPLSLFFITASLQDHYKQTDSLYLNISYLFLSTIYKYIMTNEYENAVPINVPHAG